MTTLNSLTDITTVKIGTDHKKFIYFYHNGKRISPWHNIPYRSVKENGNIHMIVEVPKWTRKKYEISAKLPDNPILQDIVDGKLREYKYGDSLINYGAIPQTWEDPNIMCNHTKHFGDNDPLDIIDIGDRKLETGDIVEVKPLGILALLDQGDNCAETDWKVISIRVGDPHYDLINNLSDVEYYKPGILCAIRRWFRDYKTARGKGPNSFAFDGEYKDRSFTLKIIEKCHSMWRKQFEMGLNGKKILVLSRDGCILDAITEEKHPCRENDLRTYHPHEEQFETERSPHDAQVDHPASHTSHARMNVAGPGPKLPSEKDVMEQLFQVPCHGNKPVQETGPEPDVEVEIEFDLEQTANLVPGVWDVSSVSVSGSGGNDSCASKTFHISAVRDFRGTQDSENEEY